LEAVIFWRVCGSCEHRGLVSPRLRVVKFEGGSEEGCLVQYLQRNPCKPDASQGPKHNGRQRSRPRLSAQSIILHSEMEYDGEAMVLVAEARSVKDEA
jgi:hypothetical protein